MERITRLGQGIFALLFLFSMPPQVFGEAEKDQVVALRERYEGTYDILIEPLYELDEKYTEALKRLLKKASDQGELESALEVKNELEGFTGGQTFSEQVFVERKATLPDLQRLKETYLEQREATFKTLEKPLADLKKRFLESLDQFEKEQTRLQNFEAALAAKEEKERIAEEKVNSGASPSLFKGRIYFVAKGDVEIRVNGERLSYSNSSREDAYLVGKSRLREFEPRDLLQLEVSGTAVYRSFIAFLESEDRKQFLPITHENFRIGSSDHFKKEITSDVMATLPTAPTQGRPDSTMGNLWMGLEVPEEVRSRSGWIKIESSTGPNYYLFALDGTNKIEVD